MALELERILRDMIRQIVREELSNIQPSAEKTLAPNVESTVETQNYNAMGDAAESDLKRQLANKLSPVVPDQTPINNILNAINTEEDINIPVQQTGFKPPAQTGFSAPQSPGFSAPQNKPLAQTGFRSPAQTGFGAPQTGFGAPQAPAQTGFKPPAQTGFKPPAQTGFKPPAQNRPPAQTGFGAPQAPGFKPPAQNGGGLFTNVQGPTSKIGTLSGLQRF